VLTPLCELEGIVIVVDKTTELVEDTPSVELVIALLELGRVVRSVEEVNTVLGVERVEIVLSELLCESLLVATVGRMEVVSTVELEIPLDGTVVAIPDDVDSKAELVLICEDEGIVDTVVGNVGLILLLGTVG